jgi:hypothetical protein
MKGFQMLKGLLFAVVRGADEVPAAGSAPEGDLKKTLDDALNQIAELRKAGDDDVKEKLKDKAYRSKVKEMMKEWDDEDDDDDPDKDKGEGKGKDGKGAVKKSLDAVLDGNGEIVDAVPVLKAFADTLEVVSAEMSAIKKSLAAMSTAATETAAFNKSVVTVVETEAALIKSLEAKIDAFGKAPQPVKGVVRPADILNKAFGANGDTPPAEDRIPIPVLRDAMIKSVTSGEVPGIVLSRWESNNYNQAMIPADAMAVIKSKIGAK